MRALAGGCAVLGLSLLVIGCAPLRVGAGQELSREADAVPPSSATQEGDRLVARLQQLLEERVGLQQQLRDLRAENGELQALRRDGASQKARILELTLEVARLQHAKLQLEIAAAEREIETLSESAQGQPAAPEGR